MRENSKGKLFQTIIDIIKLVPKGKVATYGQIAALVGPGLPARIVGYALHGLPDKNDIPWHRVINSKGRISYSSSRNEYDSLQKKLLEDEGINFSSTEKVDLEKFLWQPGGLNI